MLHLQLNNEIFYSLVIIFIILVCLDRYAKYLGKRAKIIFLVAELVIIMLILLWILIYLYKKGIMW